jgi:hypothetical protein
MKRRDFVKSAAGLTQALTAVILVGTMASLGRAQTPDESELRGGVAFADGIDAYIYGYPLVVMGMTERSATTVPTAIPGATRAPINQFIKETALPNGSYKDVVLPSTSTLYESVWLNLTEEPIILHIPAIDRFYLFETLDAWTNVSQQSPGTRIGSQPGDYALVGPNWNGTLPPGVNKIPMTTNTGWIIGRIFTSGTQQDLDHIDNDILPQLTVIPLSAFGTDYKPPSNLPIEPSIDTVTTPLHQVANMDACAFFGTLAAMMETNSPLLPQDEPTIRRLAKIHVVPGQPFDCSSPDLDSSTKAALQLAVVAARTSLESPKIAQLGVPPTTTHWSMPINNIGDYGKKYLVRALVAEKALGGNLPADAVYGYAVNDGNDQLLKGSNRYVLHFNSKTAPTFQLPPVNPSGFWSVTIYNADGTLVDNNAVNYNAIGVGPLGPTIQGHNACFNADGSLDLYIQADPPSGATQLCNWLPVSPEASSDPSQPDFIVFLRMYWPDQVVLNGNWIPPAVQKVN